MKISQLHRVKVSVSENHKPVYLVKCNTCGHRWNLLSYPNGKIRRGEWKCLMCHPPKSWIKFAEEMEKEAILVDAQDKLKSFFGSLRKSDIIKNPAFMEIKHYLYCPVCKTDWSLKDYYDGKLLELEDPNFPFYLEEVVDQYSLICPNGCKNPGVSLFEEIEKEEAQLFGEETHPKSTPKKKKKLEEM